MNFWDGVLIASICWFAACLLFGFRAYCYGWDEFHASSLNWSGGYDDGYKQGWHDGLDKGLDDGYDAGFAAGRSFAPKEVLVDDEIT